MSYIGFREQKKPHAIFQFILRIYDVVAGNNITLDSLSAIAAAAEIILLYTR